MENDSPEQAPGPEPDLTTPADTSPEGAVAPETQPAKGYVKAKKEEKPAPPPKPKKPYVPPKPSVTAQKWPELLEAISHGNREVISRLITEGVNVNTVRDGFSPLMIAAAAGRAEVVELLLQSGVNVNDRDDDDNTALHRAAAFQSGAAVIELLLQSGVQADARNKFKKTALILAEEAGNREVVRAIQAHLDRARLDAGDWEAFLNTPEGAPYKRQKQLDLLAKYEPVIWAPPAALGFVGLILGSVFGAGMLTAFVGALAGGGASFYGKRRLEQLRAYFDALEPLPELDIHIVRQKRKAREPLPEIRRKQPSSESLVVEPAQPEASAPAASTTRPLTSLADKTAVAAPEPVKPAADLDALLAPSDERPSADAGPAAPTPVAPVASPPPPTPNIAVPPAPPATEAPLPAAKKQAPVAPRAASRPTPAFLSALRDHAALIAISAAVLLLLVVLPLAFRENLGRWYYGRQLKAKGIEATDRAVLDAAAKNDLESIDLIVKAGLPIDTGDDQGRTALMIAAENGFTDLIARLGKTDPRLLDRADRNGSTALMIAAVKGREVAVTALAENGANVNLAPAGPGGPVTVLHAVADAPVFSEAHLHIMRYLLDHGADPRARTASGRTALFPAAERGREQAVALLLERGAEVNALDRNNDFPLLVAACGGHTGTVKTLLDKGADIRLASSGQTAFLCAVEEGRLDTMKLLLERGADVNTQTAGGVTVMTIATGLGNTAAVALLLDKGADPGQGYLPAPFLALRGKTVSVWAVNSRISVVLHQLAKTAARDGYTITADAAADRKVTFKARDSWNKLLHRLAMQQHLLLLVRDKEVVVLSYDPAAVHKPQ